MLCPTMRPHLYLVGLWAPLKIQGRDGRVEGQWKGLGGKVRVKLACLLTDRETYLYVLLGEAG